MTVETVEFLKNGTLPPMSIAGFAWTRTTYWVNHFRGNFWVADSSYLATLDAPGGFCEATYETVPMKGQVKRFPAESWVASGKPDQVIDLCSLPGWDTSKESFPHDASFWQANPELHRYYLGRYQKSSL
jgi:hypothetical protein